MTQNYIVFTVAGTTYALPTTDVAHVELLEDVTRVPNAPPYVDGVVFSRGEVVPAMNLRARFGFPKADYDTRTRLIVVQAGPRRVGLVVDSAREFMRIADEDIHPPADSLSGSYIRGVATSGDRMIVVLELPQVLDVQDLPSGIGEDRAAQETH